jgi:dipeptidyl aminopeptidase/acylaminoacyl peptidase
MPNQGARVVDADGRVIARSQWEARKGDWRLLALDGRGWKEIYAVTEKLDTPSLLGLGRSPGTVLLSIQGKEDEEYYEVSLADGSRQRLDFGGRRPVGLVRQPGTGRLMGVTFLDDAFEYQFLDPALERAWRGVEAGFKGRQVTPVSWSADFQKVVVQTEGKGDPGTYYLIDRATNQARKIGSAYPGVPADQVGEVKWIKYKAADGLEIPAYLTLPPGRAAKNLPLVVLPHGGPQARDYPGFDWWSQAVAAQGYAVLQPQYRGSDGFGRKFIEAGYGQWGKKMQSDLSDGVRHLAAEGVIDPKRVCIVGWSYGGYAAATASTHDASVYRCAVAGAGVTDMRRMLLWSKEQSGGRDSPVVRYWKRFMAARGVNDRGLDEVSAAPNAARAGMPVLLIHGKDDTVVPYEQSVIFQRALEKAGKPVEFVTLNGEDHWLSRGGTRTQMLEVLTAFLRKHNPPD